MSGSAKLVVTGHDLSVADGPDRLHRAALPRHDARTCACEAILAKYAAFGIIPEVIPVPAPDIPVPVQRIP